MSKERGNTLIANNKKAYHEYFIEEKFEAGIELVGTEVKSIRQGHCSIKEDPLRTRKLLLHRYEINKLIGQQKVKGYTIMPLKVYIRDGLVKMEIGLARGKKLYDKREDIAKKDMKREMERDLKSRSKDF